MQNEAGRSPAYERARKEIARLLSTADSPGAVLQEIVEALNAMLPHYSWVGIYMVEGDNLVLRAWKGPEATEHVRIPIGKGVCGWAAEKGETVVVTDVSKDERYLMCFPGTKSEIVVPIMKDGTVYGEIDVDGDEPAAFGVEDKRFLEEIAAQLADYYA